MDMIIIIILFCCCCCCIILSGGGYYYITNTSSKITSEQSPTTSEQVLNTSGQASNISEQVPNKSEQTPTTTTLVPTTTTLVPTTTTVKPKKGITIYSEPEYKGKSLFLKPGSYDKNFFQNNWSNLGIGSYKNNDNSPYMIRFSFTGGGATGGSNILTDLNNWSKIFGDKHTARVFDGIIQFDILTPDEWKKFWCNTTQAKKFNSEWPDVYPSSDCF
jgi:hypothetical protein